MFILLCSAAVAGIVLTFSFLFLRPEQYVPVAYYRGKLYMTPDVVGLLPPNEDFSRENSPSFMQRDVWHIEAEVRLIRPVPRRYRARRGYDWYHESNRPYPAELAQAGPEKAAWVQLRFTGWEGGRFRTMGWPRLRGGLAEAGIDPDKPVPDEVLERMLPVLKEDLLLQLGDAWLTDAACRGGAEPPPLPLHRGGLVPWMPFIGISLTMASMGLLLATVRWRWQGELRDSA